MSQTARPEPRKSGWAGLFESAFKRSSNAMALTDDHRRQVDVNTAWLRMLGCRRDALIGHAVYEFIRGDPLLTDEEWQAALRRDESVGTAEVVRADGEVVKAQFAMHPEVVTGQSFALFVALSMSRSGRHFRRDTDEELEGQALSEREREIVRLVALGASGPEIAEQLHISHNTVRTHVNKAMTKMGARSRAHLVAKALGEGHVL